jgi:hypothetical protein
MPDVLLLSTPMVHRPLEWRRMQNELLITVYGATEGWLLLLQFHHRPPAYWDHDGAQTVNANVTRSLASAGSSIFTTPLEAHSNLQYAGSAMQLGPDSRGCILCVFNNK